MILGIIEHSEGTVSKLSLEMLNFGRGLAQASGKPLNAIIVGADAGSLVGQIGDHGIDTVYVVEDARLTDYAPDAWAQSVVGLVGSHNPEAVIACGSEVGNELMARVAAKLDLPMAANALEVETGDVYTMTRVRWGGSLLEEASLTASTKLLTVAQHAFEPLATGSGAPKVETITADISDADLIVKVTKRIVPEADGISLTDAPIVVSGGRGVGSADGFGSLMELAGLVGGAVGCSRAVTNNGWRPHSDQVGQTGARVAPNLYIACGISGASQHISGCAGSKAIMVINSDPEAPIIAKAAYAVIGDLHEVVPAVIAEIKKRKG
ncbi:MAG: electron transfer flavoprotein alpha subunit [Cellvibrionaceae bacterium]|jgi:electron transfer flavoprotein alpha subunit